MKETGVVRRLDELGRVVIPKEIRKRLKIKNGDMVDIFTNEDSIVLKKYHPFDQDILPIKAILEALAKDNDFDLILFDEVKVIYSTQEGIEPGDLISGDLISKISTLLDKELSSRMHVRILEDRPLDKDIYIQRIQVDFEEYGYIVVMDEMIGKKHKEALAVIQNYFKHILEN